ncbi:MAG: hypothetical protein Q8L48_30480 [Archangium sp.]|nr:hypothetical protein [Archangium sp.]
MRACLAFLALAAGCTTVDLDQGYRFLCTRGGPATDCRGAFHCGLENRCLPDEPGPWACAEETDCYGWHCGVARTCYDLGTAEAVACRDDGDCSTARGWRCDPDGQCVQTSPEALRPASAIVSMQKDLTPPLWTRTPRLVSIGGRAHPSCANGNLLTVDLVDSTGLTHLEMSQSLPGTCDAGTARYELPLASSPRAVVSAQDLTYLLDNTGAISSYAWPNLTPTLDRGTQAAPFDLREFKQLDTSTIAFGDDGLTRLTSSAAADAVLDSPVRDVIEVPIIDGGRELLVATDRALLQGTPETSFRAPGDGSPCSTLMARRLAYTEYPVRQFWVLQSRGDGGQSLLRFSHIDGGADMYPFCLPELPPGQAWHYESQLSRPIDDCDFAGWADALDGGLRLLCQVDGGVAARGTAKVFEATAITRTGPTSFAASWPQLRTFSELGVVPLISNQAPGAVVVLRNGVLGFNFDPPLTTYIANDAAQTLPGFFASAVEVTGRPTWVAANAGSTSAVYDMERILAFDYRPQLLLPTGSKPTAAAIDTGADGGIRYLIATGDTVRFSEGGPLSLAFVPAPQSNITSIAPVPNAPGARFAGGYVVASGRIYRYRAENPVVWRTDELVVNADEVVEVLVDGTRGRVALRTGAVFSLPSRVQLAPPTSAPANDFVQRCEHTFALTEEGLEHLVSEGSTVGRWERLITHAGGGRLFSADQRLLVFWANGLISELPDIPCTR